jgi:SSS family solute:Na+ symporter
MNRLPWIDLAVLAAYLVGIVAVGAYFAGRKQDSEGFMAADRSLPGWAIGLSMFGSYISSISFLANPASAYAGNWNAFAFTLAMPIAAMVAILWIVPFYRRIGEVSAYEHFERRFGPWARTYAVICFLLVQMARTGTIIYLLAIAVAPLLGWKTRGVYALILLTGALMMSYTVLGGIRAVIWTGVIQSLVLIAGPLVCVIALLTQTPGGLAEIVGHNAQRGKFSLGPYGPTLTQSTFWAVFVYGLVVNLGNFAVDQSYVQRYVTAKDDREARKSVLLTALLYVPCAAFFFLIGSALFSFYSQQPDLLGGVTGQDKVFPRFIVTRLPVGMAGLVIAAIFAASMDSNLNSMATLTLCDLYKRYLRPRAGERESMRVLHFATLGWGILGTCVALAMMRVEGVLKVWWAMVGLFSGGVLGLFLLSLGRRVGNLAAVVATVLGTLLIVWISLSATGRWPQRWQAVRSPFHESLSIVFGTGTIVILGFVFSLFWKRRERDTHFEIAPEPRGFEVIQEAQR